MAYELNQPGSSLEKRRPKLQKKYCLCSVELNLNLKKPKNLNNFRIRTVTM